MRVPLRDVNVSVGCGVCGPSCVLESGLGSGDAGGAWIKRDLGDPGVSDDQSEPRPLSAHLQHRWRHPRTEITHPLHALKPNKPWCECIKAWVLRGRMWPDPGFCCPHRSVRSACTIRLRQLNTTGACVPVCSRTPLSCVSICRSFSSPGRWENSSVHPNTNLCAVLEWTWNR